MTEALNYRNVIAPTPDVRIQVNDAPEDAPSLKLVNFFVRNNDEDSPIRFATLSVSYRHGVPQEIHMGYFPSLGGEEVTRGYYVMNNCAPEYQGLRKWLGNYDPTVFAPWMASETVSEDVFRQYGREYNETKEAWRPDFDLEAMSHLELEQFRSDWLDKLKADLREEHGLDLDPECQRKCDAILDEIIDSVRESRAVVTNAPAIRRILNGGQSQWLSQ